MGCDAIDRAETLGAKPFRAERPKMAVVTPYYREGLEDLAAAHESVMRQDVSVTHIMVADGYPNEAISSWDCQHIKLPNAHRDAGNFARGIGALHAFQNGAQCVCFLDADNWLEHDHVSSLYRAMSGSAADVSVSRRTLRRLDRSMLDPFDRESDGIRFADTGTVMLCRSAIEIAALWATMPNELGGCGDQIIWAAIKSRGFKIARTERATMNYKTKWLIHYTGRGEQPPLNTVDLSVVRNSETYWCSLSDIERHKIILGRS